MPGSRQETVQQELEPRLAAVLSYLLGLAGAVILLLVERENRFVRFHALQSLLFSGLVVVVLLCIAVAGLFTLGVFVAVVAVGVWLFLMCRAALGGWYQLPWLGPLAERNA